MIGLSVLKTNSMIVEVVDVKEYLSSFTFHNLHHFRIAWH